SLGDLLVFGRRAGRNASAYAAGIGHTDLPAGVQDVARALIDKTLNGPRTERVSHLRSELQASMMDNASVFRTSETLSAQAAIVADLRARFAHIGVEDRG